MPTRLDHVALVTTDLARATAFHDAVLGAAGAPRVVAFTDVEDDEVGEEAVGYGDPDAVVLWVVAGRSASTATHVSLRVDDVATVDAVGAAAGTGARRRELDRPGYYGVTVTDPDGNTVEVFTATT